MIQDRLTAKFQSAKPTKHRATKPQPQPTVKPKATKAPATDAYTRGRPIIGSFWL